MKKKNNWNTITNRLQKQRSVGNYEPVFFKNDLLQKIFVPFEILLFC